MVVFVAVLIFLFPLGLYCLTLAHLNRRDRPTLLPGSWDCLASLLAGSGFFLVMLPTLLSILYDRSVGDVEPGTNAESIWLRWWMGWLAYYLLLIGISAAFTVWRSYRSVIYNVDPDLFTPLFLRALMPLGLSSVTSPELPGHHVLLLADMPEAGVENPVAGVVTVDPFPGGCHITLHWSSTPTALRRAVEHEVSKLLPQARPADNPIGGWFLLIGGLIFGLIILLVLASYLAPHLRRR